MSLYSSFKHCVFESYSDFEGKSNRAEYWNFWLIYMFLFWGIPVISFITYDAFGQQLYSLLYLWIVSILSLACPFLAVSVRRLHDTGLSGWHVIWCLMPYVGIIFTVVLMTRKSEK
jgi:uncharacterized membrane protein YhaH (DUF805 family)